ncbi:hypothetical protein BKA63DRAFT_509661 [Paraphoma chrysanthemicola]|nr:hypothetical protein BKA63DRAFT_509661 [Paraphoma chrysanthemicola]
MSPFCFFFAPSRGAVSATPRLITCQASTQSPRPSNRPLASRVKDGCGETTFAGLRQVPVTQRDRLPEAAKFGRHNEASQSRPHRGLEPSGHICTIPLRYNGPPILVPLRTASPMPGARCSS